MMKYVYSPHPVDSKLLGCQGFYNPQDVCQLTQNKEKIQGNVLGDCILRS